LKKKEAIPKRHEYTSFKTRKGYVTDKRSCISFRHHNI